jgi:putative transposase
MSLPFIACPAGVALHVVRRGRGHAPCFFGLSDRQAFLDVLAKSAVRFDCAIHAYVLMGNHVHLLLTAAVAGGTSLLMNELCERHTQSVAETAGHHGGLWEEAFETSQIRARRHFFACMRYIELNPVTARLVTRPDAYRWSSHAANALGHENALVQPHPFYYALGRSDVERQRAYRRLFDSNATPRARTPGARRTSPRGPSRQT